MGSLQVRGSIKRFWAGFSLIVLVGCATGAPPEKMHGQDASVSGAGGTGGHGGTGGASGAGAGGSSGGGAGGSSGAGGTSGGSSGAGGSSGSGGSSGRDAGPEDAGLDAAPSEGDCADNKKNGAETDTDCGGSECDPCAEGDTCLASSDCAEGYCNNSFTCQTPACDDGEQNGTETDKDCGGDCDTTCANGKSCVEDDDCMSASCAGTPKTCRCKPLEAAEACGATECGQKPDGCTGTVTCPYTCPSDMMCSGNSCVAMPACEPNNCSNACIPFVETRCCKSNGTCGCRVVIGGSCG